MNREEWIAKLEEIKKFKMYYFRSIEMQELAELLKEKK